MTVEGAPSPTILETSNADVVGGGEVGTSDSSVAHSDTGPISSLSSTVAASQPITYDTTLSVPHEECPPLHQPRSSTSFLSPTTATAVGHDGPQCPYPEPELNNMPGRPITNEPDNIERPAERRARFFLAYGAVRGYIRARSRLVMLWVPSLSLSRISQPF